MKTTINSINPFDIIVPERQRTEFPEAKHLELKDSIRKHGLYHAPGLRDAKDPTLVYGERRLRALRELIEEGTIIRYNKREFKDTIPYVAVGNLDDLQLREIELSENIDRLDLTWQEKARTVADLETLRNTQRERVAAVTDSPTREITLEELAAETNRSTFSVSKDLTIAKHLDDPDVAKAKSLREAEKIITRKAKAAHAATRSLTFDPSRSQHTLLEGDCREQIKTLPDGTFEAVITDPPYGINMHKDQSWDGTWHEYDDSEAYCLNLITALLPEWERVTRPQAHLYIFCDFTKFETIRALVAEQSSFEPMPYPFIWNKGNVASYPRAEHWPRKSYECILYAIRGDKPHNKLDLAVIDIPQLQHHDHPAGKPHELYAHLIERSCLAGDRVLDCFAGQGTIFEAAKSANVIATGIEMSEQYLTLAKNRLTSLES